MSTSIKEVMRELAALEDPAREAPMKVPRGEVSSGW